MIQSRNIGDFRVTRVLEFSGPTHDPNFLFPGEEHGPAFKAAGDWLAPHHWVPEMNRLIVTIQLWIVHAGSNIILVDTGVGNHKPRPDAPRFHMLNTLVNLWLDAAGARPDRVTHVVTTHLHRDHVGWNTVLADGRWMPTFPNARYLVPKLEFDYWENKYRSGDPTMNWFEDSVQPLVQAGLIDRIDESGEVANCLAVEPAPGHTPGQIALRLRSGGEEGIFTGDVMHSPLQIVRPQWNSRYCVLPDVARATRVALLKRAAQGNALIMPVHFGAPYCGFVRAQGDGFTFEPALWS